MTIISYANDIETVREVLLETVETNPLVLDQPEPIVSFNSMAESGIELTLRFWFKRTDFNQVTNEVTH